MSRVRLDGLHGTPVRRACSDALDVVLQYRKRFEAPGQSGQASAKHDVGTAELPAKKVAAAIQLPGKHAQDAPVALFRKSDIATHAMFSGRMRVCSRISNAGGSSVPDTKNIHYS